MKITYNAQFYKLNNGAYIKPSDIIPNRTIIKAWYPPSCDKWIEEKDRRNKSWVIPRVSKQELRVLGVDIAFAKGKKNDATIIHYSISIPNKDKYMAEVPYSESLEGSNAKKIALRLKQLFYDGDCDYIVLDVLGLGISVLDELGIYTYDEERDIKYPPMKCFNIKEKEERCGYKEAIPCVYGVIATETINNEIAVSLKSALQNHTLQFLVSEFEAQDYLDDKHDFQLKDPSEKVELLYPYVQTTLTQMEIVKLVKENTSKGIKLIETGANRKDRYSALAYLNKFIREKEVTLKKKAKKGGFLNLFN